VESHQLINQTSGSVEWYTPPEIIEAARKTLGFITLDPFSCAKANENVKASIYYTKEDDGFNKPWHGSVWVNHPFSRENNVRIANKVMQERAKGAEIVMITFAATSEKWFQPLLDYPQCFLHGRTNYLDQNGNKVRGVTKGSVITYLGNNLKGFVEEFDKLGTVKIPVYPK
jgi:phage N-6-adenine-methyltransferase